MLLVFKTLIQQSLSPRVNGRKHSQGVNLIYRLNYNFIRGQKLKIFSSQEIGPLTARETFIGQTHGWRNILRQMTVLKSSVQCSPNSGIMGSKVREFQICRKIMSPTFKCFEKFNLKLGSGANEFKKYPRLDDFFILIQKSRYPR